MTMVLTSQQQDALLLSGWLQLQYGHPDKACVLLAALLQIYPDHQGGRRTLLVALLKQGEGEAALAHVDQLMQQGETDGPLWLCRSRACQLAGRLDEARFAYQHYLELEEQNESTLP
ncbi:type III secretion system chaperone AscY [Aeromonas bestiarum]|uniref:Type III secretion system chaperone AscY n=1 Tax=Aeromonas bestiarum TaxID=105751 RepID=A0AAW7HV92_9GAMM|nr:type III secretion system chaperone AscY [Aeromonas bestiarum]MDM5138974.1 type III secretion system chaperone AscY [Aeromonas bestiarum]